MTRLRFNRHLSEISGRDIMKVRENTLIALLRTGSVKVMQFDKLLLQRPLQS